MASYQLYYLLGEQQSFVVEAGGVLFQKYLIFTQFSTLIQTKTHISNLDIYTYLHSTDSINNFPHFFFLWINMCAYLGFFISIRGHEDKKKQVGGESKWYFSFLLKKYHLQKNIRYIFLITLLLRYRRIGPRLGYCIVNVPASGKSKGKR